MLSLTLTVLKGNEEESLLSDLALITVSHFTGHWVHSGHSDKWLTALSIEAAGDVDVVLEALMDASH